MCGRYVSPDEAAIEREWKLTRIRDQIKIPNWNFSPTHQVPAIRRIEEGAAEGQNGTELVALRWGLIPFWAKGVTPKFGTIMATRERLATAPTWRGPWKQGRRCILSAHGFYEWQTITDAAGRPVKRPHYIRIGDQPVFGMAYGGRSEALKHVAGNEKALAFHALTPY